MISSTRTADRRFAVVEVVDRLKILAHSDFGPLVEVGARVSLAGETDGTFTFDESVNGAR